MAWIAIASEQRSNDRKEHEGIIENWGKRDGRTWVGVAFKQGTEPIIS
jgi:hypothetical protein